MRLDFHQKPLVKPYEYWCNQCRTLNLAFVDLDKCPECNTEIKIKDKILELDRDKLIRRLRDYNWSPSDEDFPEIAATRHDAVTELEEPSEASNPYEGYESDTVSGQSWLSNAAVIASIPDTKLHSTLQRYRDLVRLLEQEIIARSCAGADSRRGRNRVPYNATGAVVAHHSAGPRRNARGGHRRTQLTPLQMVEALKLLNKIKETK